VLGLAIVMESFSFRTAIIESNKVRGDQSWWRFIRRAKAPELPVILLEDLAALLGLAVAFSGVGLALLTHNLYFDVAGSAVIGALLVVVAVILGVEVKSQLLGEAAAPEAVDAIRAAISSTEGIDGVIHLKTMHIAPEELLVAAKVAVPATATAAALADSIDAAERALRVAEPMATQVFIEPDLRREDYVPDDRPEIPGAPAH
jgi:divalent metal cation (Fe/Co/Zn/Cd) transporter